LSRTRRPVLLYRGPLNANVDLPDSGRSVLPLIS